MNLLEIISFLFLGLLSFLGNIIIDYFGVIFLVLAASLFLYGTRYIRLVVENIILKREAATDGLTQLYVYRYFELKLKSEFRKAVREKKDLALAIYDIDHFKKINDTYGHEFGNSILKAAAKVLKDGTRRYDTVARYGGEEFCIVMPDIKHQDAIKHSEYIRNRIKQIKFTTGKGKAVKITISAGIVGLGDTIFKKYRDFIKAADSALYRAKNSGRDKVSVFNKKIDKII